MNNTDVVRAFMDAIYTHQLDRLSELMTEDHVFVDSLGHSVTGRDQMIPAWKQYFALCPDYWVTPEEILENDELVAVFGAAGGTIEAEGQLPEKNRWQVRAAWLAKVRNGQVREWRVYADNKPVYEIMRARELAKRHL